MVFGWNGLAGSYITRALQDEFELIRVSRSADGSDHRIDASDFKSVSKAISDSKPDVVINAVKNNLSTDQCEIDKVGTWAANVAVPENISRIQKEHGFRFIHLSTDWVYEGKEGEVYDESSIIYPQNFYSFSKAIAEERIRALADDFLILRPTGIFGVDQRGANFFMRVKDAIGRNDPVNAPSDQFSQPIFAGELARLIRVGIMKKAKGTYNAVGADYISRYDLAIGFCEVFGWDRSLVHPVPSSDRAIRIPRFLHLNISRIDGEITKVKGIRSQIADLKCSMGNQGKDRRG